MGDPIPTGSELLLTFEKLIGPEKRVPAILSVVKEPVGIDTLSSWFPDVNQAEIRRCAGNPLEINVQIGLLEDRIEQRRQALLKDNPKLNEAEINSDSIVHLARETQQTIRSKTEKGESLPEVFGVVNGAQKLAELGVDGKSIQSFIARYALSRLRAAISK